MLSGEQRKNGGSACVHETKGLLQRNESSYGSNDVMARDIVVLWCPYGDTFFFLLVLSQRSSSTVFSEDHQKAARCYPNHYYLLKQISSLG